MTVPENMGKGEVVLPAMKPEARRCSIPTEGTKDERRAFWASMSPAQRQSLALDKARREADDPNFNAALAERARKRMARVDAMPADIRELVYDYGLEIVQEFLTHKVRNAKSIRHLIDTVRATPHDNGQNRFRFNTGPNRKQNPAADEWDDGERYTAAPTAMQQAFASARKAQE